RAGVSPAGGVALAGGGPSPGRTRTGGAGPAGRSPRPRPRRPPPDGRAPPLARLTAPGPAPLAPPSGELVTPRPAGTGCDRHQFGWRGRLRAVVDVALGRRDHVRPHAGKGDAKGVDVQAVVGADHGNLL